jgi:tryptophan-rich sensory protein
MTVPSGKQPKTTAWLSYVAAAIPPFLAAFVGGAATGTTLDDWYNEVRKPRWNPPNWLFAPVWTTLFAFMGIASWRVWQKGREAREVGASDWQTSPESTQALKIYGIHLIFNTLWSVFFFGLRRIDLALVEIVGFWAMVTATLTHFYRIDRVAGLLMVPYLMWVSFAGLLNLRLWQLNRKK